MSTEFKGLEYKIEASPDYSFLSIKVPSDETIKVEASAMASMDTNMSMKTKLKGGFKRFLSSESLFINEFKAESAPAEISIAPGPSGDLSHYYVDGDILYLTGSSFVASTMGVHTDTKFQGIKRSLFSGESFFLIKCHGKGDLWFNSYGAIFEVDVKGEYVVDTGHIVAFTENLEYDIKSVGGYKSLFFSGEGLVCKFRGEGKVWIQTKQPYALVSWANYYRPVKKS